jgi:hypothetical protein
MTVPYHSGVQELLYNLLYLFLLVVGVSIGLNGDWLRPGLEGDGMVMRPSGWESLGFLEDILIFLQNGG